VSGLLCAAWRVYAVALLRAIVVGCLRAC
jgi:hypothetical protein